VLKTAFKTEMIDFLKLKYVKNIVSSLKQEKQ